jgi:phosphoglycolate phosphatase
MDKPVVVFDLDGTLIDTAPDFFRAARGVLAAVGSIDCSLAEIRQFIGDGPTAFVHKLAAAHGFTVTAALVAQFIADYASEAVSEAKLYDGIDAALRSLQAQFVLAVCTNKPGRDARSILSRTAIDHYFAAVVGGDDGPFRKPDPRHLQAAIGEAGADPAAAVMVGDHMNDFAAAAALDVPFVHATWGYGQVAPMAGADLVACRGPDCLVGDIAEMRSAKALLTLARLADARVN